LLMYYKKILFLSVEDKYGLSFLDDLYNWRNRIRIMNKVVFDDNITNLNNKLIQNQNLYEFCEKTMIKFPID
jgi:hypothetical protein